jgi:hypothetical protein
MKKLLDLANIDVNQIDERFEEIAKLLFEACFIQKGDDRYEFLEIEFYYYTKGFEDIIAYPRDVEAGKWFFHNSGVDISLESKCENINCYSNKRKPDNDYFGGVLIRSLLKNESEIITGPLKCNWALFDFFDAFQIETKNQPLIVKKNVNKNISILKTNRYIPMKDEKARLRFGENYTVFKEYQKKRYRFYINHPCWQDIKKAEYPARPW